MTKLVWDQSFRRALKRRVRNNQALEERIRAALTMLAENPFHSTLKTHKLKGHLHGLWASWVEYDCRIVFLFDVTDDGEQVLLLVDIGRHDEVY